jgi:hypothetical protein
MDKRKMKIATLVFICVLFAGAFLLGSVRQATAETLNFKSLNHVTKSESFPIADVEGHVINVSVREGAMVFGSGEWAWVKATVVSDSIKWAGPFDQYATTTFLDGSTYTTHTKGRIEATPAGPPSAVKWAGDIIQGTGRFQGIKGTVTTSAKMLPPEKGELGPKVVAEGTLVYTLPGK